MPAVCARCRAPNPPESRFCHRCGDHLQAADAPTTAFRTTPSEVRIRTIGSDLKILGGDMAAYSAPRVKKGSRAAMRATKVASVATAKHVRSLAVAAAPRVKALAQRLKPNNAEPTAPPAIPANHAADSIASESPGLSDFAVTCPRCHRVGEPGAVFCFACGLPLDEETPTAATAPPTVSAGQPAGFWIRLAAWVIDAAILTALHLVIIAAGPGLEEYFADDSLFHWVDLPMFILTTLYFTVSVSVWATTVGKRIMGMYVLKTDGSRVGFGRALAREIAGYLSFLSLGIGYVMIALRNDKRGLHDLICDTVVVRK